MSTIGELARLRSGLARDDLRHLERLVATWRPLADLSFADLLLHAPLVGEEAHRFVVLGQVRPVTGQTVYPQDMVSTVVDEVERPVLARCFRTGEILEVDATAIGTKDPVRITAIPVRHGDRLVAVVTRESGPTSTRRPGELERTYIGVFDRFARMIAEGSFPFPREEMEIEGAPRVGDGVIVTDPDTRVVFASPNAVSSLHRMGIHGYAKGQLLAELGVDDTAPKAAMSLRLPVAEETERGEVSILLQALPLLEAGRPVGSIVLIRDVTDLRRRDRMLLSKDATIREIHHRVKNNLQTIASLLRLQTRRLTSPEARAALAESERRIRSIAVVHETLSRDAGGMVQFSEIVRPLVRVVEETVSSPDSDIRFTVEGDAGDVPGEVATPLAVVLNELMQNAVDHAFGDERRRGTVRVTLARTPAEVLVEVADDGRGLPPGFSLESSKGLGLSIVHALVTGELGGSIELHDDGGTSVQVRVPIGAMAPLA